MQQPSVLSYRIRHDRARHSTARRRKWIIHANSDTNLHIVNWFRTGQSQSIPKLGGYSIYTRASIIHSLNPNPDSSNRISRESYTHGVGRCRLRWILLYCPARCHLGCSQGRHCSSTPAVVDLRRLLRSFLQHAVLNKIHKVNIATRRKECRECSGVETGVQAVQCPGPKKLRKKRIRHFEKLKNPTSALSTSGFQF